MVWPVCVTVPCHYKNPTQCFLCVWIQHPELNRPVTWLGHRCRRKNLDCFLNVPSQCQIHCCCVQPLQAVSSMQIPLSCSQRRMSDCASGGDAILECCGFIPTASFFILYRKAAWSSHILCSHCTRLASKPCLLYILPCYLRSETWFLPSAQLIRRLLLLSFPPPTC